jgi:UDP-3-O-[3-hydroxymyristoyl] glucosamine N-acyltransferase
LANLSKALTTAEIAEALELELRGDASVPIYRIASLQNATAGSISFVVDKKKLDISRGCKASALIVPPDLTTHASVSGAASLLLSDNPYLSYAQLTQLWMRLQAPQSVVHPSAVIDPEATVAETASVGAAAVVSAGAVISDNARIEAGAFIGPGTTIGTATRVHANATIHHNCVVGENCEIHSGAVIGADGFGFAPCGDGWEKICQLGRVVIGNRVSVGACTSIDRGALDDTIIGDGVILDNQIQVAHNVVIGPYTAIAGCTGIAGSATIGANCRIAGAVSIVGHISICDGVMITANTFVNRSIVDRGSYSSGVPMQDSSTWRKNAVRLRKLDVLSRDIQKLKSSSS